MPYIAPFVRHYVDYGTPRPDGTRNTIFSNFDINKSGVPSSIQKFNAVREEERLHLPGVSPVDPHAVIGQTGTIDHLRATMGWIMPSDDEIRRAMATHVRKNIAKRLYYSSPTSAMNVLFSGRIPAGFFQRVRPGPDACGVPLDNQIKRKAMVPTPTRTRDRELWEPKPDYSNLGRKLDFDIFQAMERHRKYYTSRSERVRKWEESAQEAVRLRRLEIIPRSAKIIEKHLQKEAEELGLALEEIDQTAVLREIRKSFCKPRKSREVSKLRLSQFQKHLGDEEEETERVVSTYESTLKDDESSLAEIVNLQLDSEERESVMYYSMSYKKEFEVIRSRYIEKEFDVIRSVGVRRDSEEDVEAKPENLQVDALQSVAEASQKGSSVLEDMSAESMMLDTGSFDVISQTRVARKEGGRIGDGLVGEPSCDTMAVIYAQDPENGNDKEGCPIVDDQESCSCCSCSSFSFGESPENDQNATSLQKNATEREHQQDDDIVPSAGHSAI